MRLVCDENHKESRILMNVIYEHQFAGAGIILNYAGVHVMPSNTLLIWREYVNTHESITNVTRKCVCGMRIVHVYMRFMCLAWMKKGFDRIVKDESEWGSWNKFRMNYIAFDMWYSAGGHACIWVWDCFCVWCVWCVCVYAVECWFFSFFRCIILPLCRLIRSAARMRCRNKSVEQRLPTDRKYIILQIEWSNGSLLLLGNFSIIL